MTPELYPWQQECLTLWEQNEYRGIVNAVTGAGKTRLALAGILRLAQITDRLRVKVVVPKKSLLPQWKQALAALKTSCRSGKAGQPGIGICGGGRTSPSEADYMLYVINSARYRLARQILWELREGYTVLLIADECHNYTSGENQKIFEFLPYYWEPEKGKKLPGRYCSLGLSATARGPGYEQVLVPALGKEIYHYGLERALKRGTICQFAIWQIAVSFQPDELEEYQALSDQLLHTRAEILHLLPGLRSCEGSSFFIQLTELAKNGSGKIQRLARAYLHLSYRRKRQVSMAGARTACVSRLLKSLDPGKQVLVFGESIPQIESLFHILSQSYPSRVGRYHSKMGAQANQNALERFREGSLRILLTCRALDEGLNVPEAAVGIILSGTSLERQRLQRLGRLLRKSDGKRLACLYYLFVSDSREERAYFPKGLEAFQVHNLSFEEADSRFYFPAYEKAAEAFLEQVKAQSLPEDIYLEALKCLERGYLREDWLLPEEECRANAAAALEGRERNYWICMEQMAKYRHSTPSLFSSSRACP
ncbi:MAG: DEAD/DEAH box helicase family protein [Lachnospiraceae bacterium]|nr:DEAD/DEAH box helicase family protein [Lachnospiraceae bacterium]MCI9149899.1 DEAD/DEAH box helicase family protein [Lachnospiraceae bacterium]